MTSNAQKIVQEDEQILDDEKILKLENYQRLHWDVYYKNNSINGFADRHYIKFEFHELVNALGGLKDNGKAPNKIQKIEDDDFQKQEEKPKIKIDENDKNEE